MQYRFATTADAMTLARINHALIRDEGHRNPMSETDLQVRMEHWLAGEYQAVLFQDESGMAGYALFRRDQDYIYLRQFYVQPDRRRQGLGRAAMEWLQEHVWKDGPRIRLEVLTGNLGAIQFWRSLGFSDYCITMERSL